MSTYCHGGKVGDRLALIPIIEKYGKVIKVTRIVNRNDPAKIRMIDFKALLEQGIEQMLRGMDIHTGQHNLEYDHGGVFTIVVHKGKFVWTSTGKK